MIVADDFATCTVFHDFLVTAGQNVVLKFANCDQAISSYEELLPET
jgi:hypothetical protein